jgi:plastocyanin
MIPHSKEKKIERAMSKTVMITVIAVVILAGVAGVVYFSFSWAGSAPSSGNNISCNQSASSSAVQLSINSGASNSANAPGYSPDSVIVVIGKNSTVTWTNRDSAHHTVTTSSAPQGASFNSGNMGAEAAYTCTFTTPGTYKYYCSYHSWMTGTIVVLSS